FISSVSLWIVGKQGVFTLRSTLTFRAVPHPFVQPFFFQYVNEKQREDIRMLRYAIIFLVIAVVAALLGFGGIAGASAGIAKIIFYIFLILFAIGLISHLMRRT